MQGQCSAPNQLNSNLKLQCPEGYAIGRTGACGQRWRGESFREPRLVPHWVASGRPWGKGARCNQAPSSWRELRRGCGGGGVCIAGSPTQGSERACWARNDIPDRGTMWPGREMRRQQWFSVAAFIINLNICISNHARASTWAST